MQQMKALPIFSSILLFVPIEARALEFGEFTTSNGSLVTVEEDFMDARYPRHVIGLAAQGREANDGWLIFRCQENVTEAFFVSGPFDFFGHGTSPSVSVRFVSDERARQQSPSLSSDAEAVFFDQPIDFIVKTVEGGSVGLNGSYFSGSFRHNFVLDDQTNSAVYELATTCGWVDRLPAKQEVSEDVSSSPSDKKLVNELRSLIEDYGEEQFRSTVTQILGGGLASALAE